MSPFRIGKSKNRANAKQPFSLGQGIEYDLITVITTLRHVQLCSDAAKIVFKDDVDRKFTGFDVSGAHRMLSFLERDLCPQPSFDQFPELVLRQVSHCLSNVGKQATESLLPDVRDWIPDFSQNSFASSSISETMPEYVD